MKSAIRSKLPREVRAALPLLATVQPVDSTGKAMPVEELFRLLRRSYFGAAEPGEREIALHDEVIEKVESLGITGEARAALWRTYVDQLSPAFGKDATMIREMIGDSMDRVVREILAASDRTTVLRSWAMSQPSWLPNHAGLLGWLGELSSELEILDAALIWFSRAIEQGAAPLAYWKVRSSWANRDLNDAERVEYFADVAGDPFARAVLPGEPEGRLKLARAWSPQTAVQDSIRSTLIADFLLSRLELDELIEFGTSAFDSKGHAGAGGLAVEAHLRRSGMDMRGAHTLDLSAGLALSLRIRDARRRWGLPSGASVARAMRAYAMLMNYEQAWNVSQPPIATRAEAEYPSVRNEAVVLLTLFGNVSAARDHLDTATPLWVRLQVESREAELADDLERARALLSEAIDAAEDEGTKADMCFRLATHGQVHPFVNELRSANPGIADELELIAELYSDRQGAEQRARAKAPDNPRMSLALIGYYEKTKRPKELVFIAEQAAQAWGDPELWLRAARVRQNDQDYVGAIERASRALQIGGADWGNQFDAYVVQLESGSSLGDFAIAFTAVHGLLRVRPDSLSGQWALIRLRYDSGDLDQAYRDWRTYRPAPRIADDATLWMILFRLHGSEMASLAEFFEIITKFADHRQVRNLGVAALMMAQITEPPGEITVESLLDQFDRDYPGESAFKLIEVNAEDPASIIRQLDELAAGHNTAALLDLNDKLQKGLLPIGVAAQATGRQLAEIINLGHRSPRFAGPTSGVDGTGAVDIALTSGVVVDVTALFTLTVLERDRAEFLATQIPRIVSTAQQMIDAGGARETFARELGGVLVPGDPDNVANFREQDPIELRVFREHATELYEWFRRTERVANTHFESDVAKQFGNEHDPWLTALDLAVQRKLPFWCDDAATRAIARSAGAQAFGTPSLVEHLRHTGVLNADAADAADVDLIRNWTVGVPFRQSVWEAAGERDQYAPQGLAAALLHSGPDHASEKLALTVKATAANIALPDHLSAWTSIAIRYACDIAGDSHAAFDNQVIVFRGLIGQPWMNASRLVFAVDGARNEVTERWSEVFQTAFRQVFVALVNSSGHPTAAAYAVGLISRLENAERQLALEVVLAP